MRRVATSSSLSATRARTPRGTTSTTWTDRLRSVDDCDAVYETLASQRPDVQRAKMFGMPTIKVGGKAIAGVHEGGMVFKLPDESARARALAIEGAHLFEPMAGRQMKEWVV